MRKGFSLEIRRKNKIASSVGDFYLGSSKTSDYYFFDVEGDCRFVARDQTHIIILYGEVYNSNNKKKPILSISTQFSKIDSIIEQMEGSYVLFYIDLGNDILCSYTDRTASKKVFVYKSAQTICFTNYIFNLKAQHLSINVSSLAFYLSNGNIIAGESLFQEVSVLEYATKTSVKHMEVLTTRYWDFIFNYREVQQERRDVTQEFSCLLKESIRKRTDLPNDLIVLLSGGYDSSFVLSGIIEAASRTSITAVNYSYGSSVYLSDSHTAEKIAKNFRIKFNSYNIQETGLLNNLFKNAIQGQGIANYCDEIDALEELSKENFNNPGFYFGDECFGINNNRMDCPEDVLRSLRIQGVESLSHMNSYFYHDDINVSLISQTNDIQAKILSSIPDMRNLFDLKHYLYYKTRVSDVLATWRHLHYGKLGYCFNPLLDNSILDFILTLAPTLRMNRILIKKIAKEVYPETFKIPRAKYSNNMSLKLQYKLLQEELSKETVLFTRNSVDDFVDSKKLFLTFIEKKKDNTLSLSKYHNQLNRLVKKQHYSNRYLVDKSFWKTEYVDVLTFTKRIILLKYFINEMNDRL